MTALHALEREIVTGLQRQMQMRHEAWLISDRLQEGVVDLD